MPLRIPHVNDVRAGWQCRLGWGTKGHEMKGPVRSAELQDLQALIGKELGASEWVVVSQDHIDRFADLTGDHQPIHVDPVAAARTKWGGTIAHGFFALSLIGNFGYQVLPRIRGSHSTLNYGCNRVRFITPVPSGSRIRGRFSLLSIERRRDASLNVTCNVTVEIEGQERPALVAEWITTALFDGEQGSSTTGFDEAKTLVQIDGSGGTAGT